MRYMNAKQYQEIMDENDCQPSQAVNAYLKRASMYKHQVDVLSESFGRVGINQPMSAMIKQADEHRVECVWLAIETAHAEKLQGWRYIEDGADYISALMIKYQGDLAKCTAEQRKKIELAELLDTMQKQEAADQWR